MSYQAIRNVQLNYVNTLHGSLNSVTKAFPGNDLNTPDVPTGIYGVLGTTLNSPVSSNGCMVIHLWFNKES